MTARLDKKKKIIIGVVFIVSLGILVLILKLIVFPKIEKTDDKAIVTPDVDKNQLEERSKLEIYDQDENNLKKYFPRNGENSQLSEDNKFEEVQHQNVSSESDKEYFNKQERLMNALAKASSSHERNYSSYPSNGEDSFNKIIELQNRLRTSLAASARPNSTDTPEDTINGQLEGKVKENKKSSHDEEGNNEKQYFQTVGSNKRILKLVSSETIEEKRLLDKNIIPIRIKEDMKLTDVSGGLVIPKNTVLYGKISIGDDRINISIESYKKDNTLYVLNFKVYDYDGREGIHLNNHSWIKIPSQVSKDVFDYAIERGTSGGSSALGSTNNTGIDLKEARNLAILSAGKEISKEIFEKRRVFLPKKYQLWINVKATNNVSN